jgi:hypothetical protein
MESSGVFSKVKLRITTFSTRVNWSADSGSHTSVPNSSTSRGVQPLISRPKPSMVALAPSPRIVLFEPTSTISAPAPVMRPLTCTIRGVASDTALTKSA